MKTYKVHKGHRRAIVAGEPSTSPRGHSGVEDALRLVSSLVLAFIAIATFFYVLERSFAR